MQKCILLKKKKEKLPAYLRKSFLSKDECLIYPNNTNLSLFYLLDNGLELAVDAKTNA